MKLVILTATRRTTSSSGDIRSSPKCVFVDHAVGKATRSFVFPFTLQQIQHACPALPPYATRTGNILKRIFPIAKLQSQKFTDVNEYITTSGVAYQWATKKQFFFDVFFVNILHA